MLRLLDSSPALGGKLCATKLREDGICLKQKINWRRTNEDDGNNLIILALRNSILRHLYNLMLKKKKKKAKLLSNSQWVRRWLCLVPFSLCRNLSECFPSDAFSRPPCPCSVPCPLPRPLPPDRVTLPRFTGRSDLQTNFFDWVFQSASSTSEPRTKC